MIVSHIDKERVFPGALQYRVTFNNHCVASHFISRFKRAVTLRDEDGGTFNVGVIAYTMVNGAPRPCGKLFEGRPHEYIDGQLNQFKDKRDSLCVRFPQSSVITLGLLHPSCCVGDPNTTRQQTPNRLENVQNARKVPYRSTCVGYQTLYANLCDTDGRAVHIVDYTQRQYIQKKKPDKKRPLETDSSTTTTTTTTTTKPTVKPQKGQPSLAAFMQMASNKKARVDDKL